MTIKHFFWFLLLAPVVVLAQSGTEQGKKETKKDSPDGDIDISVVEQGDMQKYQVILPGGQIILPPPDTTSKMEFEREKYLQAPVTPQEIERWRKMMLEIDKARSRPLIEPKVRTRTQQISFDAGHELPVVHIAPGNVSSLALVDVMGQPWPIADSPVVGDQESYLVHVSPQVPNVINVAAARTAGASTLSILLKDQSVPLVIKLVTDLKEHDARIDLIAPIPGPNSSKAVLTGGTASIPATTADRVMMSFVEGVPPEKAKEVRVSGTNGLRAWVYNGELYIRSIHELTSPAWIGEAHGAGGVHVYRLVKTPFILVSNRGVIETVQLSLPSEE